MTPRDSHTADGTVYFIALFVRTVHAVQYTRVREGIIYILTGGLQSAHRSWTSLTVRFCVVSFSFSVERGQRGKGGVGVSANVGEETRDFYANLAITTRQGAKNGRATVQLSPILA